MDKKFLSFLVAICIIIPCTFILSACGGDKSKLYVRMLNTTDPGVVGITVYDAMEHTENSSHSYIFWTNGDNQDAESSIPKEKTYLVIVHLQPGYDYGTLQLKIEAESGEKDIMSLSEISSLLLSAGNSSHSYFESSNEKGVLWRVGKDAVNKIQVSLIGQSEKSQYSLSLSSSETSYQNVANYEDLRFSMLVDNVAVKDAEQQTTFNVSKFLQVVDNYFDNNTFEYGQNIKFKVWFKDRIVPFNNGVFLNKYDSTFQEYNPIDFEDRTFDTENCETIYSLDIEKSTSIKFEWFDSFYENMDYDKVRLTINIAGYSHDSDNYLSHETIQSTYADFIVSNVSELEYQILMKNYTKVLINYNSEIAQSAKLSTFTYDNGTLTIHLIGAPIYHEKHVSDYITQINGSSGNKYEISTEIDGEALLADNSIKSIKINHFYNGQDLYENNLVNETGQIYANGIGLDSVLTVDNDIYIFDGTYETEHIYFHISYCPNQESPEEHNELIQKIVLSDGTNSFDLTFNGESFSGTSTIDGLTFENNRLTLTKTKIESLDSLTFTYYI